MVSIIRQLFGIETGFQSLVINTFARLNLERVVDEVNDETLDPWARLLHDAGLADRVTPLSPFMEKELLRDLDLSLDGAKFENVVGFRYLHERLTIAEVEAAIQSYKEMGWWP
ncbi:hypothetical protein LTR28_011643 [Elasticomyces elasticus]|nr:hypothetical protein LTR28_011673 [Elasticomyces elasticus]KAK4930615.1 hypothetical protein LTR28_011643 [Elasticomyces elasticus]